MFLTIKEDDLITFKPSVMSEINIFNPKENEQYLIKLTKGCPFTNKSEISILKATVVDFLTIQDSEFDLCFRYTGNYGIDSYVSFEDVKIISKLG